ncbi:hypothetical protein TNCV_3530231 [Trichonephila clavipes]|uniref:Uncharacterized protein n=1 Tax=Trichonephila clavipes TaxID=2585209 RepID=A0A8X6RGI3_TRICX|nr:hypothetical protein TNCV_3530231 [Trichonephila clavipes]
MPTSSVNGVVPRSHCVGSRHVERLTTGKLPKHSVRSHAYANKEIWDQSDYGAADGKTYIRQRVSGTVVILITAAITAGYQDLGEFVRDVIVGA